MDQDERHESSVIDQICLVLRCVEVAIQTKVILNNDVGYIPMPMLFQHDEGEIRVFVVV
jgi:hypothetical protein